MEWLQNIIGGIASAASGGIFGFLGAGVSAIAKHFQQKQAHKQKIELVRLEMELNSQQGSWKGLQASHEADAAYSNTYPWVNSIRSLFRPMLTAGLVVVCYLFFRDILSALGDKQSALSQILTQAEIKDTIRYIIFSLVFSTATAIAWWFGERALTPPELKNR